jgi:hypothetical protein
VNEAVAKMLERCIDALDVEKARREVFSFVKDQAALALWSREFFHDVAGRIRFPPTPEPGR